MICTKCGAGPHQENDLSQKSVSLVFVFNLRLCVEISLCKGVHLCHYTVCWDVESNIWVICCLKENQKRHWMHFLTWLILLCETLKHNLYNHYSLCVFCFLWFNNCCKSPVSHLNNKSEMKKSILLTKDSAYMLQKNHLSCKINADIKKCYLPLKFCFQTLFVMTPVLIQHSFQ